MTRLVMRRRRGQLPDAAYAAAALVCFLTLLPPTGGAEPNTPIPNFAPDNMTGWLKGPGDEFIQPESGAGPIKSDPALPYVSNAVARQETVKIADLTNPILQPWVREQMRKANEEVLAGKVGFTARARCWPHGVPGFLLYPVHPIFFIQAANDYSIGPTLALAQSLEGTGKLVESRIYPQWGLTPEEGHLFESRGSQIWGADVRHFLERWL